MENLKNNEIELYRDILSGKVERIYLFNHDYYIGMIGILDKDRDIFDYDITIEYDEKFKSFDMHIFFGDFGNHYHFDKYEIEFKEGD